MKATEKFKDAIKRYLDERASQDELFAISYAKEHKNLDECINYIFKSVQESGCNGFADEEIYGMAIHYYDEDDIKDIKHVRCKVVVNHQIELTEEEKLQAHKDAINKYQQECINKMRADEKAKADKEIEIAKACEGALEYFEKYGKGYEPDRVLMVNKKRYDN